jgi:uncharacterized protein involved in cysteine biosynthesis
VIFTAFFAALGQIGDRRFFRVLLLGVGLSLALLIGIYALFLGAIELFVPDTVEIPLVGPVGGLDTLLSIGSFFFMIGLSIFLMMPVASAFASLFLEDVAAAVEDRHYPSLPPGRKVPFGDALVDTLNFFGLLIGANLLALVFYFFAGPFIPLVFWAVNGLLLGREYFQLVAMRRMSRAVAKALRSQHFLTIWAAGTLMAAPLSIPLVNLLIPVLGVATFTHLFHRLEGVRSASQSP